ncbi:MAG: DUF4331 family protein [Myxococcota bacterium]|nr:DUF4331 family protein [Myxococcota bacterium]
MNILSRLPVGAAALGLALLTGLNAQAADHAEAPASAADPAADIADLYAWHTDSGTLVTSLTFAGLGAPGDAAVYDEDVLYGIHIDNDGDNESDIDIWARFGQDSQGNWGVQVSGLPGAGAPVSSAVETVTSVAGGSLFAGLRDDPFFFDLAGFNETVSTGDVSFDSTRDSLAGTNVTAIVLEMDLGAVVVDGNNLRLWATSGRI